MWSSCPLPDLDRHRHFAEIEPPRAAEHPVVLQAPLRPLAHGLFDEGHGVDDRSPLREGGPVDRGKAPPDLPVEASLAGLADGDPEQGGGQPRRPANQEEQERSSRARPLVVPTSSNGTALESSATAVTRSPIRAPQTAAYGPPHDQPITANRSMPSASVSAATSAGQSSRRRPGWKVDRPIPGRSGEMSRTPRSQGGLVGRSGIEPGAQAAVKAQDGIAGRIAVLLVRQLPAVGQGRPNAVIAAARRGAGGARMAGRSSVEGDVREARIGQGRRFVVRHAIGCCCERERGRAVSTSCSTELPPATTPAKEFLGEQFDRGLAWLHYPEGSVVWASRPRISSWRQSRLAARRGPRQRAEEPDRLRHVRAHHRGPRHG